MIFRIILGSLCLGLIAAWYILRITGIIVFEIEECDENSEK